MKKASLKYWAICVLTAIGALVSYLSAQPQLTEATIFGGVLLVVGLGIHDLENIPEGPVQPPMSN